MEADAITSSGSRTYILNLDPWRQPLCSISALLRLIREIRPDVVHCHGLEGNLFGLPAARLGRVPIRIAEEIGIPNHSARTRAIMRIVYRMAHRVVGVSDAVWDWLIASGEVPARKAVRLYNPVETSSRRASPRPPASPLKIAFLGRLDPVKNVPGLVEAMTLLPPDVEADLLIIGDGPQRCEIEQLVLDLGLQGKVAFHGFSTSPEVQLSACHLYVQPSLVEGFGIAVAEAMSCGLPAIVSGRGGMGEIVEHRRTGWVLASTDPPCIAEAIAEASRLAPMELAQMGAQARQSVQERFSVDRYVTEVEQLYEDCGR